MHIDKSAFLIVIIFIAIATLFRGDMPLEQVFLSLPGLIIALTLHEYAHAKKAVKLGDPTPKMQGRLTVNPMAHLDPLGTICLLFCGFGWGKPVQINPTNFSNPQKDEAKVAAAGPIMNMIISLVLAVVYGLFLVITFKLGCCTYENGSFIFEPNSPLDVIGMIILYAMILNVGLALFNLLPFPPLDGSKIYRAILKGKAREFLYSLERYSMIIIGILFVTRITSYILSPLIELILNYVLFPIINLILRIGL